MPTPDQILSGLTGISNDWLWLAIAWHVVLAGALAAVAAGLRPPRRVAALLLCLPLASVSTLAFLASNPFNGSLFAALALALAVLCVTVPKAPISRGPAWSTAAGSLMVAFGWVYPHFLEGHSPVTYLYGAPLGLIPCPTLSAVIGLTLLAGGLDARAWPRVLAGGGLFYGLFGALRLGVMLDWVLVAGALALVIATVVPKQAPTTS
jgi:hypothetical protein